MYEIWVIALMLCNKIFDQNYGDSIILLASEVLNSLPPIMTGELAADADEKIRTFQADAAREAGVFHHLITLPTYHTAAFGIK